MPYRIKVDPQKAVVISRFDGILDRPTARAHMDQLLGDPTFRSEFFQLIDFRSVTRVDLTAEDVRALADREVFSPHSRRAFLVATDIQFGLSRLFGTHRNILGEKYIAVFRAMAEAANWIGLDEVAVSRYLEELIASRE